MSAKKSVKNESPVLAFLSGRGPNPLPERKKGIGGRREQKFLDEALWEVAEQDKANEHRSEPSVAEDLMAVIRLVSDNREMIRLIISQSASTVSDLALKLGRELPNVSRTLSKMAAYGLVGFEGVAEDARSKRPVWMLPDEASVEGMDWVQAYCLSMALKARVAGRSAIDLKAMARAVRDAVVSTAEKIERSAAAPVP
jgi:predicted transcriptional regulator